MDELKIVGRIPGEKVICKKYLSPSYIGLQYWGNKVYIVPFWGNGIVVYDIVEDTFFQLQCGIEDKNFNAKYVEPVIYNDRIICFPYTRNNELVYINTLSNEIKTVPSFNRAIPNEAQGVYQSPQLFGESQCFGALRGCKQYFIYDIENHSIFCHDFPFGKVDLRSATVFGDIVVCSIVGSAQLVLFELESNKIISEISVKYKDVGIIKVSDEYLLLDSIQGEGLQLLNVKKGVLSDVEHMRRGLTSSLSADYYGGSVATDKNGDTFYLGKASNSFINLCTQKEYIPRLDERDLNYIRECMSNENDDIFNENEIYGLKEFISSFM